MKLPQIFSRLSRQEQMLATRHLHLMLKAGITLDEAVSVLIAQAKGTARLMWQQILDDLSNGSSLYAALVKHRSTFDIFYLSLIRIGEESGTMVDTLDFLAGQLEKDLATRNKLRAAMLYPVLVLIAAVLMGGFIALFVLPQLVDFFSSFEVELPLATRILLFVATFSKNYGVVTAIVLLIAFFLFTIFIALPAIKPHWDRFILRLPMFGRLIALGQLSRFCRNFGVLLKSGLPVSQCLETTAGTMSNQAYKRAVTRVNDRLHEGSKISQTLEETAAFAFPPLVTRMIGIGEKTGDLDDTLLYLADYFDQEIDIVSKNFVTLLEPMLLLGIGLLVAFVAFAIIGPIYQLTGSL